MSCSPCTIIMSASGGITSPDATINWLQVGTTPNTGGAYLPDSYAGLSSLVAAAYAFARSGSITVVSGSYRVPSFSIGRAIGQTVASEGCPADCCSYVTGSRSGTRWGAGRDKRIRH